VIGKTKRGIGRMREEDLHLAVRVNRLTKKFKATGIEDVSFEVQ
jgi:hypothetical protein